MFRVDIFTTTDLPEVGKVMIFKSNTARKTLKLCRYRPMTNFNTVLMFKYSKYLSIFIKKHLFLGCVANWSRFWTGVSCLVDSP